MSEFLLKADGFEDALIGVGRKKNCEDSLVYDYNKCIEILISQGMTDEEAVEYMEYNVVDAYVGPTTPIFVHTDPHDSEERLSA